MNPVPCGWAEATLGELCLEMRNGISIKPVENGGLPILRISAVRPMKLDVKDTRFLPANFDGLSTYKLRTDDLLFTRYNGNRELVGACARVAQLGTELVYPDKLIRVRLNTRLAIPSFVEKAASAEAARRFIDQKLKTSAGQVGISGADLKSLPVPLPPRAEQQRIADKLDTVLARVDACRERLARVAPLLKRFRQSVLGAAASGRLTEQWRVEACDESGMNALSELLGVDGLPQPGPWELRTIEQLRVDCDYSLAIGPFGSSLKVSDYRGDGVPLIFVREIRARAFGDERTKYVSPEKASDLAAHTVQPGDLLITKMGDPPGDVAIYPDHRPAGIVTSDCVKLSVNPTVAITKFVAFMLESPDVRARLRQVAAGVAQQKFSLARLRTFSIPVAPLAEQSEIVRRVETLFAFADRLEARLTTAQSAIDRLTPALLAKAFRGELVPQDSTDEPATELLKRLQAETSQSPHGAAPRRGRPPQKATA